jgi:hypothetical protein
MVSGRKTLAMIAESDPSLTRTCGRDNVLDMDISRPLCA